MVGQETARPRDHKRWGLALVMLLALLVRCLVAWQTRAVPFVQQPVGDARGYLEWGSRIAEGEWIGSEAFYQSPLYPYVLGLVRKVSGFGTSGIRFLQACFGAAASGLLSWGAMLLWGRRVGLCVGVLAAVYGPAIYYDGLIQKASLDGLLVSSLFLACAQATLRTRNTQFLCVGLLTGLTALNRENVLIWVPLLSVWALVIGGDGFARRSRACIVFLVGVVCILGPVAARNAAVGGIWSVTTYQAGSNFYIGNSRDADGRYRPLVRGHETPDFERADATRLAEEAEGRTLSPGEVSRFWFRRTWADIGDDPGRWIQLLARKFAMVWNRYEVPDVEGLVIYTDASFILRWASRLWHFGWLGPLAVVGMIALSTSRRAEKSKRFRASESPEECDPRKERATRLTLMAMIVALSLSVAFFYVLGRYRHPLAVLLLPFAGAGLIAIADSVRPSGSWKNRWAVCAVLLAVVVNAPVQDEQKLDAHVEMNAGVALAQTGAMDRATAHFERAVVALPGSAEANNNLAQALALQGDFARAIPYYEQALLIGGDLPGAEYNLGVALEQVGRLRQAAEHYGKAVRSNPRDTEAKNAWNRLRPIANDE